jgi:hypothetical protein
MKCNIPAFLAKLATEVEQHKDRVSSPLVAVDENLGARRITIALKPLVAAGRLSGLNPLWYEKRVSETGESHFSPGSLSKGTGRRLKLSSRQGWQWDDESTICHLVVQFGSHDRLVLLTEDRGTDPKGVAPLLAHVVRPSLEAHNAGRLGLLVLGKMGKTTLEIYVEAITNRLTSSGVAVGYSEVWI